MSIDSMKQSRFDQFTNKLRSWTSGALKLAFIILAAVIAWRIAWSNLSINLSQFNFSDLLAMILALFAMGMSVAFYFKTTDSSNQFYDNIYNFTQKTSEILGRIEERFGERLKHLDEGYDRMQSRLEVSTKNPDEIEKKVKETEGREEEEKKRLEEANREMQEMMEKLAERAEMQQIEKEEFYRKLNDLQEEKDRSQMKIHELEDSRNQMAKQLRMLQLDIEDDPSIHHPIIMELLHYPDIHELFSMSAPHRVISREINKHISKMPNRLIDDLRDAGIINTNGRLTSAGIVTLRSMYHRIFNE